MLSFIAAVYNEEKEVSDLVHHVAPFVSGIYIADDGSTDDTFEILQRFVSRMVYPPIQVQVLGHQSLSKIRLLAHGRLRLLDLLSNL